jgi:superfamily II DNA or RNA helicase/formylglycine-generating enzyme required for sulfatase activity/5-methylcytosine-specific restriction endonuclease McrA
MTAQQSDREFYCEYDLVDARKHPVGKEPASHQSHALNRLDLWYETQPFPNAGGILVLPTGGGKTFTAVRFLCRRAISDGYKILWLAHTHHLLEQAYRAFDDGVALIAEPKASIAVRVVSGTPGHYPVRRIKASDDVLVGTLQTIGNALKNSHQSLERFLTAARSKLLVVFDEAHHSPAPSYRNLVLSLRERFSEMYLLGLTATPTYSQEAKKGWLHKLFPQGIVHQVTPQQLMAAGILAKPILEQPNTNFDPEFDEREYKKWLGTHRDVPQDIIKRMAENQDRNLFISNYYAAHKDRFGKTIMFADRWHQCEQISEFLRRRGVKTGTVYSHVDADPGSVAARNNRGRDENAIALQEFRDGQLDVLLNVKMLTEGTDVPDIQTVFLTRSTTSQILLTQMVGRALRGPKFGGTDKAYIVSFIDNWKHLINWAEYGQLAEGLADESMPEYGTRPPVQLISIELIQRLSRQMDSGINMTPGPFVSLLPVGWYRVEYQSQVEGSDDLEPARELVMVFEAEHHSYQEYVEHVAQTQMEAFEPEGVTVADVEGTLEGWRDDFFSDSEDHFGTNLLDDMFRIARHTAQNGVVPKFFEFAERDRHNLDEIAEEFVKKDLGPLATYEALDHEYSREDRLWTTIYYRYDLFKSQYDACVNRILHARRHGVPAERHRPKRSLPPDDQLSGGEPSEELKLQVKKRDNFRCLCCGPTSRRTLRVDHIVAQYHGGGNALSNLQTLCGECNLEKSTDKINFRTPLTTLTQPPESVRSLKPPTGQKAAKPELWSQYLSRCVNFFYRCGAVLSVEIGSRGERFYDWHVELNAGNDPRWILPLLKNIVVIAQRERAKAGYGIPNSITVSTPGFEDLVVTDNLSDESEVDAVALGQKQDAPGGEDEDDLDLEGTQITDAGLKHLSPSTGVAGTDFTNSIGMRLKLIAAGTFMMGSPPSEPDRYDDETQHRVRISKPFYLGVYEVTQGQYEKLMGENPSYFEGDNNPVDWVTWKDAELFCRELSARPEEQAAGRVYRLPTEAEWEYACRAGTTTAYSFGDDRSQLRNFAWYEVNAERRHHPVGQKKPNPWGLYDMHGNVCEWCQDWYGDYPSGSTTDPTGAASGSNRVSRGGSWGSVAENCRSADRYRRRPSICYDDYGFRVALSPSGQ